MIKITKNAWIVQKEEGPAFAVRVSLASPIRFSIGSGLGPMGPAGPAGGVLAKLAGTLAVSGHRVVVPESGTMIKHADPTDLSQLHSVIGVTLGAASPGGSVLVVGSGEIEEGTWTWTPGAPIYAGAGGVLSQIPPIGVAWLQIVAVAESATKILVALREPIALT